MQPTELVDLILIFAPHFDLVLAYGGFFFFRKLEIFIRIFLLRKKNRKRGKREKENGDLGLDDKYRVLFQ